GLPTFFTNKQSRPCGHGNPPVSDNLELTIGKERQRASRLASLFLRKGTTDENPLVAVAT
ncbi:MAG: hypothetical protein Q8Q62_09030, partial [Mesorhizobium sp.]|nr:hypothetical protein [Mesorhizobium sp.]